MLGTHVIEHLFLAVAPGTEHALVVELAREQLLRLGPHSLLGLDQQLLDPALEPALLRVLAHDHPRLEELLDLLLLPVGLLQHVLQPRLVALLQLVAPPALDALQRRRTGKDAQKAIQKRVAAFMASDREDLETRLEFNRWLYAEGLVVVFDLIRDTVDLGTGTVNQQGQILEIDQRLEDAAAFGLEIDGFRDFIEGRDRAIAAQLTP